MIPAIDQGALITIMPARGELPLSDPHMLRILGPLGAGGSGCIYLGRLEPNGGLRAVKVPRDWARATEIYHETRYLIASSYPHVVPIHGIQLALIPGAQHPVPVLLLSVVGTCLAERLVAGAVAPALAIRWVRQLATGLQASSLLHRDLKPENVLIDAQEDAWLCDFGLCLPARAALRARLGIAPVGLVGTPLYMAPEQLYQAADIDERADIYALGLLLYERAGGRARASPPPRGPGRGALPRDAHRRRGALEPRADPRARGGGQARHHQEAPRALRNPRRAARGARCRRGSQGP